MAVYVDDMRAPLGRMIMCHMLADTEAELHKMAADIGVARKWFQGDHYDIALSKRRLAVRLGAKEITQREAVRIRNRNRNYNYFHIVWSDPLTDVMEDEARNK